MLCIFLSLLEEKPNKSDVNRGFGKICKVSKKWGVGIIKDSLSAGRVERRFKIFDLPLSHP